ncbi:hypothetical protein Bca4012_066328 [Brassica carinata]
MNEKEIKMFMKDMVLQQHARRILSHSSQARLFCSNTNRIIWSSNQTLQSCIESALHQKAKISTVLEQWQRQGNNLNPSLVRGIFEKLRDSKLYPQALEVSTWMVEREICSLVPEDYTTRFHLIDNVLGFEEAVKFLEKVPENLRNEYMYTTLLKSYAKKTDLKRAEAVFKKMRELGLLLKSSQYSSMASLYIYVGYVGKVDEILREMKENNVELDSLAVAKAYLRAASKREAREMLLRAEEQNDPASYEELMKLYAKAGDSEDVYRIWNQYKKTRKQDSDGYLALFASLLNLDDITEQR